jgi:hypothetical protein
MECLWWCRCSQALSSAGCVGDRQLTRMLAVHLHRMDSWLGASFEAQSPGCWGAQRDVQGTLHVYPGCADPSFSSDSTISRPQLMASAARASPAVMQGPSQAASGSFQNSCIRHLMTAELAARSPQELAQGGEGTGTSAVAEYRAAVGQVCGTCFGSCGRRRNVPTKLLQL